MVIMKFGGASLADAASFRHIAEIIRLHSFSRRVIVLSAVRGVTDHLIGAIDRALTDEHSVEESLRILQSLHQQIIEEGINEPVIRKQTAAAAAEKTDQLKRLLSGVALTGEATSRIRDRILSFGERLSVLLMAGFLACLKVEAYIVETDAIGLLTKGNFGNGTVDLRTAGREVAAYFKKVIKTNTLPVVTGYFGQTEEGDPITFGRGGTDYSAAVLASLLHAERLEVWKDVDGFLSGAPDTVPGSRLLSALSYEEVAELAYFGAGILHPRTVEPLLESKIPIVIRNTFKPDKVGTWINEMGTVTSRVIKSVTYDRGIALLRVHGADVGYTVGLLSQLVSELGRRDINIRSVLTSQTCINILIDRKDMVDGFRYLRSLNLTSIDAIEPIETIGLVAMVGEGLSQAEGVVAFIIDKLTAARYHMEMIVSGASRVAAYFIVRDEELEEIVRTVHAAIFDHTEAPFSNK